MTTPTPETPAELAAECKRLADMAKAHAVDATSARTSESCAREQYEYARYIKLRDAAIDRLATLAASSTAPEGWKPGQPITEAMHVAACKVLARANGLDGTPQRMLDAMMAAAPAAPERKPDGWLPIETAPKDGRTNILLTNGTDVSQGGWCHDEGGITEHRDLDGRYIGQDESEGYIGWLDFDGGMQPDPTHWMPLPAAPAGTAAQDGGREG